MKVTSEQVTQLTISNIKPGDGEFGSLDPITVTLKNYRTGVGEITIKCFQAAWTAGWGGMGGQRVEEFFVESDDAYLIGHLTGGLSCDQRVECPDWLDVVKQRIIQLRLDGSISDKGARKSWNDAVDAIGHNHHFNPEIWDADRKLLSKLLDSNAWWEHWPRESNPDYAYLMRVVQAVREGLWLWMGTAVLSSSEAS